MMKTINKVLTAILLAAALTSCMGTKLEETYNKQEAKIDSYISGKGDGYISVRNGGANRLITKEGEGEELQRNGFVSFYYAGYTFNGSFSSSNLFVTNHQETAEQAKWNLTDAGYQIYEINLGDARLTQGLKDGLLGVKAGEECEILFSGKYGFGNEVFGMIPANSAQLWKIWVVGVAND
ncbi:MAG: FKBP-type peptidyl-prolyl cis-trans isomerase [Bacteroidales bacterium]|nr:FKBP-type peptidyl-prolyl cis-trans isomerase [Bacteroidales bacterium]